MGRGFIFFAVVIVAGLTGLRVVLGVAGIASFFLGLLLKMAVVCAVIYIGILIVSPDTARKMREHFLGPA